MVSDSAPATAPASQEGIRYLDLGLVVPSPTNPRSRSISPLAIDEDALLAANVLTHGILQPILVRPKGKGFEVVAGHRRLAAAQKAKLDTIPALVRELSDAQAKELQLIENLQRKDLHALDEAEGYRQLMAVARLDVAKIATRIGRSVKYVYDRVKLLGLTPAAQSLFRAGTITAGHAILLARLSPASQQLAMDPRHGGLLEHEDLLWDPRENGKREDPLKARSVRELQGWIDKHVRFNPQAVDGELFPGTAATLGQAKEKAEKVVAITQDHFVQESARTKERVFGPASWKRVTGKRCPYTVTGVIVIGPGRGEAFPVCVDKQHCATHWPKAKRSTSSGTRTSATGAAANRAAASEKKWAVTRALQDAARKRWEAIRPKVLAAVAARVKTAPAGGKSALADLAVRAVVRYGSVGAAAVPRGTTADSVVRHLAFLAAARAAHDWDGYLTFPKIAKALGVDLGAIVKPVAAQTSARPKRVAPRKPARPRKRK